jgi:hypothetical protein
MPNVLTESIYALVSASVSAIDGKTYGVQNAQVSAGMGTMFELMLRLFNHVDHPSAALISGGSAGAVVLATPTSIGMSAVIPITYQGVPYYLNSAAAVSGSPASNASPGYSTTSTTIRKVLVGLTFSALPLASSPGSNGGAAMVFVYGSAYTTSAGVVTSGGASAYFNLVPLPKPSAGMVPVGWLNIPNSFAASAGIDNTMMICDLRATQGYDLSAIQGTIVQP